MSKVRFTPQGNKVAIDVYPWALACEKKNGYAIEGIFRHVEYAVKQGCTPIIVNTLGEKFPETGHSILSAELGFSVSTVTSKSFAAAAEYIASSGYKVWLSPAMDFLCPVVEHLPPQVQRHVIVHDVMSYYGAFGERNSDNFKKSLRLFDMYYPVSEYTRSLLEPLVDRSPRSSGARPKIVYDYKGFLPLSFYSTFRQVDLTRDPECVLAVGSVFKRKQVERLPEAVVRALKKRMTVRNVGRFLDPDEDYLETVRGTPNLEFHEEVEDHRLRDLYSKATYFFCISREEGFSIPPLEALASGVPIVFLSDIPVHRELYRNYTGVYFLDPDSLELVSDIGDISKLSVNTKQQALKIQHDWHPSVTTLPMYRELTFSLLLE